MRNALIAFTFLWLGLLIGLAFIETPLKFQAPGITKELALGIGRLVFGVLNKIEWGLAIIIASLLFRMKPRKVFPAIVVLLIAILAAQSFYLLPILNDHVTQIKAGVSAPPSGVHIAYMVTDIVKLIALITFGVMSCRLKETAEG